MTKRDAIARCLAESFPQARLAVEDLSSGHNKHETHFRAVLVDDQFADLGLVERQKKVSTALQKAGLLPYALSTFVFTETEWQEKKDSMVDVPLCHSKASDQPVWAPFRPNLT